MINSKYFLLTLSGIFILGTAQTKAAGEILRDASGNVRYMTYYEASGVNPKTRYKERPDACQAAGKGHLPTIRELANEAQARGSMGILEVSQVNPDQVPAGYNLNSAINPYYSGVDEFYFNHQGYKRLDGDLGNYFYWSSSVFSNYQYYAFDQRGDNGFIGVSGSANYNRAVRCFPDL